MPHKFLDLKTSIGNNFIVAVDSIALVENDLGHAKITLKEKDEMDKQKIISTLEYFEDVKRLLYQK